MKYALFIYIFMCSFVLESEEVYAPPVDARLDFSSHYFSSHIPVSLDGEWEFYWEQLLSPDDLQSGKGNLTGYIPVPGPWNKYNDDSRYTGTGYATYRVVVETTQEDIIYGIKMLDTATSYRLYVNGRLLISNGVVADNKAAYQAEYRPKVGLFLPQTEDATGLQEVEIVIQVANFIHRRGGLWVNVYFGEYQQLLDIRARNNYTTFFMIGLFSIMSLYHFGLFLVRRKDHGSLFFAMFSLLMMIRLPFVSERIILSIFPTLPFELLNTIEYIGAYIQVPFILLFVFSMYQFKLTWIAKTILISAGSLCIVFLFTPVSFYSHIKPLADIYLILSGSYVLAMVLKAVVQQRQGAVLSFIGFSAMLLTGLNDILRSLHLLQTVYISHYGLFLFMLFQSHTLSKLFSNAFSRVEKLTQDLQLINESNRRFVPTPFLDILGCNSIVDLQLGDHVEKKMTILFCDIRSFTSLSENMTPDENFMFINEYLYNVGPAIRRNNGFIDKYIGDGVMALFPERVEDALDAALEIIQAAHDFSTVLIRRGMQPINVGIGIHHGKMMLGMVGEEARMEGTVISDVVNIASRTEDLSKLFKTHIVVTDAVMSLVQNPENYKSRYLGVINVKGKTIPVSIYELFTPCHETVTEQKMRYKNDFETALGHYIDQNYDAALEILQKIQQDTSESGLDDAALALYINWCVQKIQRVLTA